MLLSCIHLKPIACLEDIQEFEQAQRRKERKGQESVSDNASGESSEAEDAPIKARVGCIPSTWHAILKTSPRKLLGPAYKLSLMTRATKNKVFVFMNPFVVSVLFVEDYKDLLFVLYVELALSPPLYMSSWRCIEWFPTRTPRRLTGLTSNPPNGPEAHQL